MRFSAIKSSGIQLPATVTLSQKFSSTNTHELLAHNPRKHEQQHITPNVNKVSILNRNEVGSN